MISQQATQISIVSACRNELKHIREFLDSLITQDLAGYSWEAIVADGMSTDGTREILEQYSANNPNIRAIHNPGLIVSSGLNAAIRASRGNIVLRMDAHTTYAADYCRKCVETLLKTKADNVGGPARTRARGSVAMAIAAAYHSRFSTGGARFHDPNYEGWVDTVPYGCWHRKTLERIGLFDEELVRNQDDELNLRLARAGGKIWQSPAIQSWYSPRPSIPALFNQYLQYGFWKVAVVRKHRHTGSWRHYIPAGAVIANFVVILTAIVAQLTGAKSVAITFAMFWISMTAAYLACCLIASISAARKHGWQTFPYLPLTFAAFHASYGLGFLGGLAVLTRPSSRIAINSVFSRITR